GRGARQLCHSREAKWGGAVTPAIDGTRPARRRPRPPLPASGWRRHSPNWLARLPARGPSGTARQPPADRGRNASQTPELLKRWAQYRHGGERPDEGQRRQRARRTGYRLQWTSRTGRNHAGVAPVARL